MYITAFGELLGFVFLLVIFYAVVLAFDLFDSDWRIARNLVTGVTPAGILFSPCGKLLYVANNNNYSIPGQDNVAVVDVGTRRVLRTISHASFNQPFTLTYSAKRKRIYVTNSHANTVTVIDAVTEKIVTVISGFDGPSGFVIDDRTSLGYANNYGAPVMIDGSGSGKGHTVSVVDLSKDVVVSNLEVGLAPSFVALSPCGGTLYVGRYNDGKIGSGSLAFVDTKTFQLLAEVGGLSGPFGCDLTPCGKFAVVTNFGSNDFTPIGMTAVKIDLIKRAVVAEYITGVQPSGVVISACGKLAYVSNYNALYAGENFTALTPGQGSVSVIDLKANRVLTTSMEVGRTPAALAISKCGKTLVSSNFTDNSVTFVRL